MINRTGQNTDFFLFCFWATHGDTQVLLIKAQNNGFNEYAFETQKVQSSQRAVKGMG